MTRLLIADDDPQILRALRIILSSKGYQVVTAADGQEALEAAISARPDILIIDLGMPRLDGVALIEAVRGWSQAPILVISGRTTDAEKVRALDVGADDYVTKPFSIDELLARIRAMNRRLPQEQGAPAVHFGDVTVDLAAQAVTRTVHGATRYIPDDAHRVEGPGAARPQPWGAGHQADDAAPHLGQRPCDRHRLSAPVPLPAAQEAGARPVSPQIPPHGAGDGVSAGDRLTTARDQSASGNQSAIWSRSASSPTDPTWFCVIHPLSEPPAESSAALRAACGSPRTSASISAA